VLTTLKGLNVISRGRPDHLCRVYWYSLWTRSNTVYLPITVVLLYMSCVFSLVKVTLYNISLCTPVTDNTRMSMFDIERNYFRLALAFTLVSQRTHVRKHRYGGISKDWLYWPKA